MTDRIKDYSKEISTIRKAACQKVERGGEVLVVNEDVVCEHELEISVNGMPAFRLTCTPQHLTELVLGRLRTERIIDTVDEVEHLFLCGEGNIAEVRLREDIEFRPYSGAEAAPAHVTPVDPSPADVFALTEQFRADSALHRSTGGTHSCYIRFGDGRILSFEDIGRHNALDKAVGAMLLEGMDPADCMLYTTGRVAADMVTKAIGAGIPVMISKAVPTEEAVILAKKNGLTLICRAWPDSFDEYM